MTFNSLRTIALALCTITLSAGSALAQASPTPPATPEIPLIDVSVGYQRVEYGFPSRTEARGAYIEASLNAKNGVGLFLHSATSYSYFEFQTDTASYRDQVQLRQNRLGLRYSRRLAHVTPFAQVLVGSRDYYVERTTTNLTTRAVTIGASSLGADTIGAVGVGLTAHMTQKWGLRVGADYEHVWYTGGTTNGVRLIAGVVFAAKAR